MPDSRSRKRPRTPKRATRSAGRPRQYVLDAYARLRWRALNRLRIAGHPVTQAALARCLGCSQPYVSTLLNGSGKRSWMIEQRFAALVGEPHARLFPPHPDHPDDPPDAPADLAGADRRTA